MPRPTALSYIRQNVMLPGENFIPQWNSLTPADKAQMQEWAEQEMDALGLEPRKAA